MIIWALYDDAESSVSRSVPILHRVLSIGINDIKKEDYYKIDLSITNNNLFKELSLLPKPDIIVASPPCESWSIADTAGVMLKKINKNGDWFINNANYYDEYNKTAHPVKKRYFDKKEKSRILGEATAFATIEIIKHFKPKYWYIENPLTSKIWKYYKYHLNFKGVENDTYYSSYDSSFSLKPTRFLSNINLHLRKERKNGNKEYMRKNSYSKRSAIPLQLIEKIITEMSLNKNE